MRDARPPFCRKPVTLLLPPLILAGFLAGLLAGCSALPAVGPSWRGVPLNLPSAYAQGASLGLTSSTVPYWQALNDPLLARLETQAMAQNLSIKQAWQRVKQARSAAQMAQGAFGPSVNAQGGYQGQRIGAQANLINGTTQTMDTFSAGLGASWEIDLFGGTRRAAQGAKARAQGAQAQADGMRSMVLAEVARTYVLYRSLQQQVALMREETQRTATLATLVGHQAQVGLVEGTVLAQANARAQAKAMQLPPMEAALTGTQHALESLLGQNPGTLQALLASPTALPALPPSVTLVLPSQLVLQRPDVRAYSHAAQAATADVGVAMADVFPHFSLTGSYGAQAPTLDGINTPTALVWSGGPQFRWALFNMGRVWQNIALQKSRRKEAVLAYQQAALDALADVETRLAALEAGHQSLAAATLMAQNTAKIATLSEAQHAQGLINGLMLNESHIANAESQRAALQTHQQALWAYINLHQSLGL